MSLSPVEAQLVEMRRFGVAEVARLAGIPGPLLLVELAGSSLTYQNISQVAIEFARATLAPLYLAPIEETLSDLLPRGWAVRADLDELFRADLPTRWDAYRVGVDGGWMTADEVRAVEGIGGIPAPLAATPPRSTESDPLEGTPT
jgi:phage portal protein BeeE